MKDTLWAALVYPMAFLGVVGSPGGAFAQSEDQRLEDVIVTAQKVETNIQRTPLTMSALSEQELKERQISDVEALLKTVPNVDFGVSLGTARLAIRGVGLDAVSGGVEGRIAYHQDGVYYSRPASVLGGFFDVKRVEALRGPQGTLYGRNATGGVINVITQDPSDEFGGFLNVNAGNYDLLRVQGAIGGPLSDTLSARIAFQTEDRSGYGYNETTGTDVDDKKARAARLKVRYAPTDRFDFMLTADYMGQDDHGNGYVFFDRFPLSDPRVVGNVTPQPLSGELFGGVAPSKARNTSGNVDTQNDREFSGIAGVANYSLGDLDFTSVTAYRKSSLKVISDIDQTSAPIAIIRQDENSEQFSEELRVHGQFEKGEWLAGTYYFKEDLETGNRVVQNAAIRPNFRTYNPNAACPTSGALPRRACTAADLAPNYVQGFTPWAELQTEAYALFANVKYDVTDRWSAHLGARYSSETKTVDQFNMTDFVRPWPPFVDTNNPAPPAGVAFAALKDEKDYEAFTPSVTLSYQASDDMYLYATWAKGFKSGSYNLGAPQAPFNAEKITDYEVGAKIDWLDNRLRTNFAAFYYDYKDIQASRIDVTQTVIFNAPGADVKGFEFELVARPTSALGLEISGAWLDTSIVGPYATVDTARPWLGPISLAGNELAQSPKLSVNVGADYTWRLPLGELTLRGESQYKEDVYLSVFNLPYVAQKAHWMSNAFLNFRADDGHWNASLYVRNIEDELVRSAQNVSPAFWGTPMYGAYAAPRTYGLELGYSF